MANKSPKMCLVCATKTTKACGGCDLYVDAQVWSTHKWLCKKPKYTFSFAPLSPLEHTQALEMVRSTDAKAEALLKKFPFAPGTGWKEEDNETIINALVKKGCAIPEPTRSSILIQVHALVRRGALAKLVSSPEADFSPWSWVAESWEMSYKGFGEGLGAVPDVSYLGPSHMTVFNALHRHLLVYWTLVNREANGLPLPPTLENGSTSFPMGNACLRLVVPFIHRPVEAKYIALVLLVQPMLGITYIGSKTGKLPGGRAVPLEKDKKDDDPDAQLQPIDDKPDSKDPKRE
ncbi:hypothetical protein JCM10449v2_001592 [Rhodotorula kratochvilovae]